MKAKQPNFQEFSTLSHVENDKTIDKLHAALAFMPDKKRHCTVMILLFFFPMGSILT